MPLEPFTRLPQDVQLLKPISAGQAKIRIGPISGTKVPYPLPRRFPHVVPNPISAFDGSVPDKLPFTKALEQASNGNLLQRQWRFVAKQSFITKLVNTTIAATTTQIVVSPGIQISLGLNQAIKIRRFVSSVVDHTNSNSISVFAHGTEIFSVNDLPTSPSGDIPANTGFIFASEIVYIGQPAAQLANSGVLPPPAGSIGMSDSTTIENEWFEFDDYADFFQNVNRGLIDITMKAVGKWNLRNTSGGGLSVDARDSILYEIYELVT